MSAFDDSTLVTDDDLTAWESRMPDLAKRTKAPSGSTAYDGKRQLAKTFLAKQLLKRGVDPSTLSDPSQLKDAATFKELELIFSDLSSIPDGVEAKKARMYSGLFDDELELVILQTTATGQTIAPTISSIPCFRA